ncbi:MAG TPA: glycosyltransferase family 87 protein [Candidatus Sulfomarinibacteraceae bacterium]|nr:glycosyltransferase family 87 protein [Candidatus Sulfomarinibacteraceae bacterium]
MSRKEWILAIALALFLFVAEGVAVHEIYASRFLGGNDFYPRWSGARALLLEGRDPYDPALTAENAAVLDPNDRRTNSFSFAYPLHVMFLMWPLALLPYSWAYALWMVTVQWAAFLLLAVLLRWVQWRPSPAAAAGLLLSVVAFYPISRSIILGQFTVHITLFVALTLLAMQRGRDGWAGIFLASTSVKPQMVIFLVPWLLLWAARRRRWRLHLGLLGAGVAYLVASLLLFPRWPLSFIEDLGRYSETAGGRAPLAILASLAGPDAGAWLQPLLAILLLAAMLWAWRRAWQHGGDESGSPFRRALSWTIIASLLVPFQTGSTGQVLLAIPFFLWLTGLVRSRGKLPSILATAFVVAGGWLLFMNTFSGESPLMFLALPLLALLILTARELWPGRPAGHPAPAGEAGA